MLKTIFKTLLLFILMFVPSFVGATESAITVKLSKTNVAGDEKIDQSKGHRMPPRPIVGIINVSAGMIDYSADLGEDVEVYEVWNVDGSAVLASFVDEAEFVDFLALNADRELQIRITLTSYALIGYIY
ncbi:MAG: hypothetical protein JFR39_05265 [Muribaculaceae bacterium]|nr:hypothetical protein [Muribaculaceae bacterium]